MPIDTQEDIETLVSATRRFGDDLQSSTGERNPCGFCERGQKSPIETMVSAWVQQPRKYTGGQGLAICGGSVVPEAFCGWRTHDSLSGGRSGSGERSSSEWEDQPSECVWSDVDLAH